jgi:hypothetical protein
MSCCPGGSKDRPDFIPHFEVLGRKVFSESYTSSMWAHCKKCGTVWQVDEDPGYHYPYQTWNRSSIEQVPADAKR